MKSEKFFFFFFGFKFICYSFSPHSWRAHSWPWVVTQSWSHGGPLWTNVPKTGVILLDRGRCAYQLGSPSGEVAAPYREADSVAPERVGRHPASYYAPGQAGFSSEEREWEGGSFVVHSWVPLAPRWLLRENVGPRLSHEGEYGFKATPWEAVSLQGPA